MSERSAEAIVVFDDAIERISSFSEGIRQEYMVTALANKGLALGELGRSEEAIAVFNDVVMRLSYAPEVALREGIANEILSEAQKVMGAGLQSWVSCMLQAVDALLEATSGPKSDGLRVHAQELRRELDSTPPD